MHPLLAPRRLGATHSVSASPQQRDINLRHPRLLPPPSHHPPSPPCRLDAIRFLSASLKQREIELRSGGGALGDAEVVTTIQKLAKQRRDSIEQYQKGGPGGGPGRLGRARARAGHARGVVGGCAMGERREAAGGGMGRLGDALWPGWELCEAGRAVRWGRGPRQLEGQRWDGAARVAGWGAC